MKHMKISLFALLLCLATYIGRIKANIIIHCNSTDHCRKCQVVLRNCYLSGTTDISSCVKCAEKQESIPSCLGSFTSFLSNRTVMEAFVEMEPADYGNKHKHHSLIQEIVDTTKTRLDRNNPEHHKMSDDLKKNLIKLCNFDNFNDNYKTAAIHEQGTPEEIDEHVKEVIRKFSHDPESMKHIKNVLSNPALCLKHPDEWVTDRSGLEDVDMPSVGILKLRHIPQFAQTLNLRSTAKSYSLYNDKSGGSCNMLTCNRFDDPNECEYNIRRLNQGSCGNCWAFATNTTFSALRCRRGLGFAEVSVRYLTHCKASYFRSSPSREPCSDGGHILHLLKISEKTGVLPTSFDMPYEEPLNSTVCPTRNSQWTNLWDGVQSESSIIENIRYNGFLKVSFGDYARANKIEELITLVKGYIRDLGALFVSIRAAGKLSYDHNGAEVWMNCETTTADHAVTLIGYGVYTTNSGERRSYWVVRNSWGETWGDRGNFKIDMHGPTGCNGHVLSDAFPLLLSTKGRSVSLPVPNDLSVKDKTQHDPNAILNPKRNETTPRSPEPIPLPPRRREPTPTPTPVRPYTPPVRPYTPPVRPYTPPTRPYTPNNRIIKPVIPGKYLYKTTLKFRTGSNYFERTITSTRPNEHKEPNSCLRAFSSDSKYDVECRKNCESIIATCSAYVSVGECLQAHKPHSKCFYCGV